MMNRDSTLARNIFPLAAAFLALVASETLADAAGNEATIYYVNDHSSAAACGGDSFSWGDDTAWYLSDKLNAWSWDRVYLHGNLWVDFKDFADRSIDRAGADGDDPDGIDSADLGFIYTHGTSGGCSAGNAYSRLNMGDDAFTCNVKYGKKSSRNDVEWGNTDLNIMILDACRTLQKCVFDNGGYFVAEKDLAALLGFHGISYDSASHTNHFENFVDDSRWNGLGDNWVDDMTYQWIGWDNDECGTAVVFGSDSSDGDRIFQWGGLQDWKVISSHLRSWFYYISGCNPGSGDKLPSG